MLLISPTEGQLTLEQVAESIHRYIGEEPDYAYKIIVGTDSQTTREATTFVSAVILHRIGKGARYFYASDIHRRIASLRQRIFYETSLSLALADQLSRLLDDLGCGNLRPEIHLDVGNNGETRDIVKDVTGMVMGSGFDALIKPYACGASKVADRYTK